MGESQNSPHRRGTPALTAIPPVLHQGVVRWLENLQGKSDLGLEDLAATDVDRNTILRLVASSEFAARTIARFPEWFAASLARGGLAEAATHEQLRNLTSDIVRTESESTTVSANLRIVRNQQLLKILWRSIGEQDSVPQTLHALSLLADALIDASIRFAQNVQQTRFGIPENENGEHISLVTLAMGKLGGEELNFSSDVDLIFLYTEEGHTNGRRSLSAHEYFTRLTRQVIGLLDTLTEDGFVYRVDTRLRPFGDSGPPVVSFAALENYLLRHGRGWERYAYVKARPIGPALPAKAVRELQVNVIEPFVYRRYLDFGVFESLRDMQALIATEVEKRELQENIKLGPGGIREIEFIAQAFQLLRGGSDPKLRCRGLRPALTRAGESALLSSAAVANLLRSYDFLRKLENGLQAIRDQQTHELPEDASDQARLALIMQQPSWCALLEEIERHRQRTNEQFSALVFQGNDEHATDELPATIGAFWNRSASRDEWRAMLDSNAFVEAASLADLISQFSADTRRRKIGVTAQKRLARFVCTLLLQLRNKSRPDIACRRVLAVVAKILRRSAYIALLNENPAVLSRLVSLCEQSNYLATEIARFPLLLDELLDPRLYSATISQTTMRNDLVERLDNDAAADSEVHIELLAQFQRASLFRIAVADVSSKLPIMNVSDRLTELAEIVLQHALQIAWRDLQEQHGLPVVSTDDAVRQAEFVVIAYGKLGGIELSYRSDLDLVFLHDSVGTDQQTNGPKPLENSMFFSRLVRRLVHFLTIQTGSGALYEVDTRLRPSGRAGLLVVNTEGFERYQEENAWTWEHQALLRSRAVAGSPALAEEFERIRAQTLRSRVRTADLLTDVTAMRQKMRERLDKSTARTFDLKQGQGGIGDIEFLVQYLVLANARNEVALIRYTDNIRQLDSLESAGVLPATEVRQLQEAYKALRLRTHRLALDGKQALVPHSEFVNERALVCSLWEREMI